MTNDITEQEERDIWSLEDVWVNLKTIIMNMDKLTFKKSGDVYDMTAKSLKIINKALNERENGSS